MIFKKDSSFTDPVKVIEKKPVQYLNQTVAIAYRVAVRDKENNTYECWTDNPSCPDKPTRQQKGFTFDYTKVRQYAEEVEEVELDPESKALTEAVRNVMPALKAVNPAFSRAYISQMASRCNDVMFPFASTPSERALSPGAVGGVAGCLIQGTKTYCESFCDLAMRLWTYAKEHESELDTPLESVKDRIQKMLINNGTAFPASVAWFYNPLDDRHDIEDAKIYRYYDSPYRLAETICAPFEHCLPSDHYDKGLGVGCVYPDGRVSEKKNRAWVLTAYLIGDNLMSCSYTRFTSKALRDAWAGPPGLANWATFLWNCGIYNLPIVYVGELEHYNVSFNVPGYRNNNNDALDVDIDAAGDWRELLKMCQDADQKHRRFYIEIRPYVMLLGRWLSRELRSYYKELAAKHPKSVIDAAFAFAFGFNKRRPINNNTTATFGFPHTMINRMMLYFVEHGHSGFWGNRKVIIERIIKFMEFCYENDLDIIIGSFDEENSEQDITANSEEFHYLTAPWHREIFHGEMISSVGSEFGPRVTGGWTKGANSSGNVNTTTSTELPNDKRKKQIQARFVVRAPFDRTCEVACKAKYNDEFCWELNGVYICDNQNTDDMKFLAARKQPWDCESLNKESSEWLGQNHVKGEFCKKTDGFGMSLDVTKGTFEPMKESGLDRWPFFEHSINGKEIANKKKGRRESFPEWVIKILDAWSIEWFGVSFFSGEEFAEEYETYLRRTGFTLSSLFNLHSARGRAAADAFMKRWQLSPDDSGDIYVAGDDPNQAYTCGSEVIENPITAHGTYNADVMRPYYELFLCYMKDAVSEKEWSHASEYLRSHAYVRFDLFKEMEAKIKSMPSLPEYCKRNNIELRDYFNSSLVHVKRQDLFNEDPYVGG